MNPLVSVMIGAYNAAPYLGEAIESVLGQDYEPIELIVVDDGSTDGTADVARSFAQAKVIQQENGGNGSARNRAVENASGELYAFLDADDRFTPGKLSLQKAVLDADPGLDMVFGHVREFFSPELDEETRASLATTCTRADAVDGAEPDAGPAPSRSNVSAPLLRPSGSASPSTGSRAPRKPGCATRFPPRSYSSGVFIPRTTGCERARLDPSISR